MSKLIEEISAAVKPVLEKIGFELVDVEFEKKHGQDNLTIFIDSPNGISLDECEKAHHEVDVVLDQLDPIEGAYILNVSSPGLDRPFKTQRDFERNYGKEVEIKLNAPIKGKKYLEGVLSFRDENVVIITQGETDSKTETKIENTRINYVRPLVKFS